MKTTKWRNLSHIISKKREDIANNTIEFDAMTVIVKNYSFSLLSGYRQDDGEVTLQLKDYLLFIST